MPDPEKQPDEKPTETPEERLTRMEAAHQRLMDENAVYKKTLDALSKRDEPPADTTRDAPPAGPQPMLTPEQVQNLRAQGYSDDDIRNNIRVLNDFLGVVAAPVVRSIGVLADRSDAYDWMFEDEEAKKPEFRDQVEKERMAGIKRGEFRSRKDIALLLKAKRTPAGADELEAEIERRVQEKLRGAAGAAATETGARANTQKVGPGPVSGHQLGGRRLTTEEFAALPLAEKKKHLDEMGAF